MYVNRKQYRNALKVKVTAALLAMLLAFGSYPSALVLADAIPKAAAPVQLSSRPVTAGVTLREYRWEIPGEPARIYVMEIDLKNPYVQVDVIPGGGKITQRLNVSGMAGNAGAVAAVNGDFYNTKAEGAPIGPMVIDGRLASSPSVLTGIYALGITADREARIDSFSFVGKVVAPDGREFSLSGLNKTIYWEEPSGTHSHVNKLHLYNDMWGGQTRGQDEYTVPTEILVDDRVVVDISRGQYFAFPVPEGMQILRGSGQAATFLESFQIGDPIEIDYAISPALDWSMIVGGHALLVDAGRAVPYTKDLAALGGVRARTAAGVSQDGTVLYLVGVEGRTTDSAGLSLPDLAAFFEFLGAWRALNLDGGGSATMVARPLGDLDAARVYTPEQVDERAVVNAIGVFSNAPTGELKGFVLDGNGIVLVGEEAEYSVKAYDEYYNPLTAPDLNIAWSVSGAAGSMQGNIFTARQPGVYKIRGAAGSSSAALPVEVVGKQGINVLTLSGPSGVIGAGSKVPLRLTLNTVSGKSREIPANLVDWQFYSIDGSVSPQGILTVEAVGHGDFGYVVARYQGYSAPFVFQFAGERPLDSFASLSNITFQGQPGEVRGELTLADDPQGAGDQVVRLDYDFNGTAGTTAAYVQFAGEGLLLDGNAQALLVDVYGSSGGEWLRAELQDAAGTVHRVDLASQVNWTGWQTLQIKLDSAAYAQPLRLKRVYPVVTEEQRPQRPQQGALYFANLRLAFDASSGQPPAAQRTLVLTVGEKTLDINGTVSTMDVAPVITGGRTMVPVRFVSEALNARVEWNEAAGNVTVVQAGHWIDLWPGETMMVVDGRRVDLDVAPLLSKGRTMLPLRAVAQALDLTVDWNPDTGRITLKD